MSNSLWPHGLYSPWNSPGQNTGGGSCSLLQGIFPTQGSNPGLPHCRWILYHLSHQGSPNHKAIVIMCSSGKGERDQKRKSTNRYDCMWIPYQLNYQGSRIYVVHLCWFVYNSVKFFKVFTLDWSAFAFVDLGFLTYLGKYFFLSDFKTLH